LIIALAVAGAIVGYVLYRRQKQLNARRAAWRTDAARTLDDARLTRDLLDDSSRGAVDPALLETMKQQTAATTAALGRLATTAPDTAARQRTEAAAQALTGYVAAIETEQMVTGQDRTQVSEDALVRASEARRAHARTADDALTQLDTVVHPEQHA
jgi:hypothetical protein